MKTSVYRSEEKKAHFRAVYNAFLSAMPFEKRTVGTPAHAAIRAHSGRGRNAPLSARG